MMAAWVLLRRIARLRLVPKDVFSKLDYTIAMLESLRAQVATLAAGVRDLGALHKRVETYQEVLYQVAELQDELVRRALSDNRLVSEVMQFENSMSTRLDSLGRDLRRQGALLSKAPDALSVTTRLSGPDGENKPAPGGIEAGLRVRSILGRLKPETAERTAKIRIGDARDGRVCLDAFDDVGAVLSAGRDHGVSWVHALSAKGVPLYTGEASLAGQFASNAPRPGDARRVDGSAQNGQFDVRQLLEECRQRGEDRPILDLALSGGEWAALDGIDLDLIGRCSQIVCTFHHLDRLAEQAFGARADRVFDRITRDFFVCHVHGDNRGAMAILGNVPVPERLTVTFANRSRFDATESSETFPTALDKPNQDGVADIFLGSFRF